MERYSRWRDGGTGIQPFLPPVSSSPASPALLYAHNAVAYPLAIGRFALLGAVALLYIVLVEGIGLLLVSMDCPFH